MQVGWGLGSGSRGRPPGVRYCFPFIFNLNTPPFIPRPRFSTPAGCPLCSLWALPRCPQEVAVDGPDWRAPPCNGHMSPWKGNDTFKVTQCLWRQRVGREGWAQTCQRCPDEEVCAGIKEVCEMGVLSTFRCSHFPLPRKPAKLCLSLHMCVSMSMYGRMCMHLSELG